MFRKYYHKDVIFSSVLISFSGVILLGVFLYTRIMETTELTPDLYLFITITSLMFIVFLYCLIRYFFALNRPILDYEIDFDNEVIKLSKKRKVNFSDIKLFARKEIRSEIKIFFGYRTMNINETHLKNDKEESMTEEQIKCIGKYAISISHRKLYNYNLISAMFIGSTSIILGLFGQEPSIANLGMDFIILLSISIFVYIIFLLLNQFRLKRLYEKKLQEQGTKKL